MSIFDWADWVGTPPERHGAEVRYVRATLTAEQRDWAVRRRKIAAKHDAIIARFREDCIALGIEVD